MAGGFFKDESQKLEFLLFIVAALWLVQLAPTALAILTTNELVYGNDQYYWFTLQDPGGGSLSYPVLCITYLRFLHLLSGEDLILFMQIAALFSLLFFLGTLLAFHKMGISTRKIFVFSILAQPLLPILLLRIETIPIFLTALAMWLFYSGKRMGGWLALLAGALFKVLPIFFAPLFLAMELKNFNRNSALRIIAVALISLLAFALFPDNLRTVIFNSERGIQLESTYASLLLVANYFLGLGITVELNYGAHHLVLPPYLEFVPLLAMGIQVFAILSLSALFFKNGARKEELFTYAFLVAAAMVLLSKVFSTQFMLWPLIFAIPVLAVPWGSKKIQKNALLPALALYICSALAYLLYRLLGTFMEDIAPLPLALLVIKNLLLFGVFAWVFLNREKFYLTTDSK